MRKTVGGEKNNDSQYLVNRRLKMDFDRTQQYGKLGIIGEITPSNKTIEQIEDKVINLKDRLEIVRNELEDYRLSDRNRLDNVIRTLSDEYEDYEHFINKSISYMSGELWALEWFLKIDHSRDELSDNRRYTHVKYMIREYILKAYFNKYYDIIHSIPD